MQNCKKRNQYVTLQYEATGKETHASKKDIYKKEKRVKNQLCRNIGIYFH